MHTTNQQNAQHSTGPRTDAGKRRSSLNAFRHGLTGQTVVMPGEDIAPYQTFCKRAFDELKPQGLLEEIAVQAVADTSWRLNRARTYESALFSQAFSSYTEIADIGEPTQYEAAPDLTKMMTNLSGYEQRLTRTLERATQTLIELQKTRRDADQKVLDDAKDIRRYFKTKKIDWNPQDDGFVFTGTELDTLIRREDRTKTSHYEVLVRYKPAD